MKGTTMETKVEPTYATLNLTETSGGGGGCLCLLTDLAPCHTRTMNLSVFGQFVNISLRRYSTIIIHKTRNLTEKNGSTTHFTCTCISRFSFVLLG